MSGKKQKTVQQTKKLRPPIIAVLGHVDHGKTTLLDTIRKSNVAAKEAGGITQKIGAYQITTPSGKKITFIDTPGHEAFAKMRSRGVTAADIAILVVSATEGVKPQTIESINHIKKAGVPYIVALNKIDLPESNPDKVKQELASHDVLVEQFGGNIVVMPVSGKTGKGIPELLDALLLISELEEDSYVIHDEDPFSAVVIESSVDKRKGITASLIIKSGKLIQGQLIYAESAQAKVRTITTDYGSVVKEAFPSDPIEVLGWKSLPEVGSVVTQTQTDSNSHDQNRFTPKAFSLPPIEIGRKLNLILKTDTLGSLEVLKETFAKDTNIQLVSAKTGEITDSDILLGRSTKSLVIGFNVFPSSSVKQLAQTEDVNIKTYSIIYELIEEISEVSELLKNPESLEQELGRANVIALFETTEGKVAGCKIEDGRVVSGDIVKIFRKKEELGRTKIKSIRQGKQVVSKVEKGHECGVLLDKKLDLRLGDLIIAFKKHELLM